MAAQSADLSSSGMFLPSHTAGTVLCPTCGERIAPNPSNTCVRCLRTRTDLTASLPRHLTLVYCPDCSSYLHPPRTWLPAAPESKTLLSFCLRRLKKPLSRLRLVHAEFLFTEPHSKRIKVKIRIQGEIFNGAIAEQSHVVEFTVTDHLCDSCSKANANPDQWVAKVQLRQHVAHRRTFFYLEQLVLKHKAAEKAVRIQETDQGVDFMFGNLGPLVVCTKVTNSICLMDPFTLRSAFLDADKYWRVPFKAFMSSRQLVEYIVLDVEVESPEVNVNGSKYCLAHAQVARVSDFGKNDNMFMVRTHLGHLLNPGDYALGYDLYGANGNDVEIDKYKGLVIPEAILIKKSYEEKRQRRRGKARAWKLKSLNMEVDTTAKGKVDPEKRNDEYEEFLKDLEENPEMRFNISLYRNKEYQPSEVVSTVGDDELPSVPLDELLADLDLTDGDGEGSDADSMME